MAAAEVVNAPPAAATLVLLGSGGRVDRAADSAGAVRLTLQGAAPVAAAFPPSPPPVRAGGGNASAARPAPLIQGAAAALAAVPAGAPLVLTLTTADGVRRSLVARVAGTPQWLTAGGDDASPMSMDVSVEAELVAGAADVSLSRGAAAAHLGAPGGLTRTNLPSGLVGAPGAGAALMVDVRML